MCGIVAGVTERNITPILLEGLRRLEYRGYDSAGIGLVGNEEIQIIRSLGKISSLAEKVKNTAIKSGTGIAHTRWATHGIPSEKNAHPQNSNNEIAIVHNGIIENFVQIREKMQKLGYVFQSDTDTETVAHLIHFYYQQSNNLISAVQTAQKELEGAYAIAVIAKNQKDKLVALRHGAPLVVGIGIAEYFLASDAFALLPVTRNFIYLQDGDSLELSREQLTIFDKNQQEVQRNIVEYTQEYTDNGKSGYNHFMQKEMFEQPQVLLNTLEGRVYNRELQTSSFSPELLENLKNIQNIDIVACGTSYHAGLTAKYKFEAQGIKTTVEQASEYIYRDIVVNPNTLLITISQSGETADTLCALEKASKLPYLDNLAICNVPESALVRTANHSILTRAGREIGVASTKAFTTQLLVLDILSALISKMQNKTYRLDYEQLEFHIKQMLSLNSQLHEAANLIKDQRNCLFLGRGINYPIAAEGALKLKELTYIHAEAYPAGELKHGPLALIDQNLPVIALVQADLYGQKTLHNLQEVQARGGKLIIFADNRCDLSSIDKQHKIIRLGEIPSSITPIAFVVPLQLLAYNTALQKGTDIDQPRNLAKSVTVE